ncbi:membrane protein [Salmonella enterica subsp. arizonae]|uniref:Membrane protein n=1 Tax=Salmonella enterica subsp. arizonae TaxID=59203 RepID=A0A379TDX7_SALER|nr:membrane protein [Salmonella enterica subsp. arizonae]
MDRFPRSDSIVQARSGLQTYMAQVYGWDDGRAVVDRVYRVVCG